MAVLEASGSHFRLCPDCGQPLIPIGLEKRDNEWDHAQGCKLDGRTAMQLMQAWIREEAKDFLEYFKIEDEAGVFAVKVERQLWRVYLCGVSDAVRLGEQAIDGMPEPNSPTIDLEALREAISRKDVPDLTKPLQRG